MPRSLKLTETENLSTDQLLFARWIVAAEDKTFEQVAGCSLRTTGQRVYGVEGGNVHNVVRKSVIPSLIKSLNSFIRPNNKSKWEPLSEDYNPEIFLNPNPHLRKLTGRPVVIVL